MSEPRSLDEWARRVVRAVQDVFGVRSASVLLRQEDMGAFLIRAGVGLTPGEMGLLSLPFTSPVVSILQSSGRCLLADALEGLFPQRRRDELADLRFVHACAMAPIFSNGRLFALMCVGPKLTGEMFNQSDIDALSNLAHSAQYALAAALAGQSRGRQSAYWAHDMFRPFGPKGAIQNVVRALRGDFGPLPEVARAALAIAAEDANFVATHMKQLTNPLAQELVQIQSTPLTAAFNRSRDRFSPLANEKSIVLNVDVPPENLLVFCDASLIEHRVLANLLENAMRHTPSGGKVRVGYRLESQRFVGFVEDTGPGIRKEDLPTLFQPGTQLDPQNKGLAGLGLASVKSVMEAHGGAVTVQSAPGQCARFEFILPIGRSVGTG
ncbi:MAG: GAF domain-containing sensor histidine kinase [Elusimicrobia bacterium]|nr:GAF domain-containing sensor histidine kinase [Elusimicrobiota bacterium]